MVTIRTIRLPDALGAGYGQLLFDDGVLIAVVACLANSAHSDECERWNVEASFLPEVEAGTRIFDLDAWISGYEQSRRSGEFGNLA